MKLHKDFTRYLLAGFILIVGSLLLAGIIFYAFAYMDSNIPLHK